MKRFLLIAIVLAGLLLRLGGISHGLEYGEVYHPDTPKQVRAVGEFLDGERYMHIGKSDYDGYPLFVSYLTSLIVRAGVEPLMALIGMAKVGQTPDVIVLFWIMRLVNVALAALAVFVAWRIGKENFSEGTGLIAACLLALSPADVAACHYASGDTGAAVFGLVSVLCSLRIHREGRWRDYAFAGFFGALAFASKYHALVVFAAAGLAHLLRAEHFGRWHRPSSLARLAVTGLAAAAGLYFAIPGLREAPLAMIADIRHFMGYAANFGLTPELKAAGFAGKMTFSLQRNLPILLGLLSAPAILAALWSLRRVREERALLVLLAGPLVYFLVGVSLRPYAHPVYHTILTAPVFVLAAAALARPFAADFTGRRGLRPLALAGLACAGLLLAHAAWREVYFFRRDDTRRYARAWSEENLPGDYKLLTPRYTFNSPYFHGGGSRPDGLFYFSPSMRPEPGRDHCERWFSFGVEKDALPVFRNPEMEAWLHPWSSVTTNARMPVFQRVPSRIKADYLFTGLPEYFRSPRLFVVNARETVGRIVVAKEPLADVLITVSAGAAAARLEFRFGTRREVLKLTALATTNLVLRAPRESLPWATGFHHYDFEASAKHGGVRIALGFNAREKGVDLFQQGNRKEAAPWLEGAALEDRNPSLAAMALLAGAAPERRGDLRQLAGSVGIPEIPDAMRDGWGVAETFLDGIPYLHWNAVDLAHRAAVAEAAAGGGQGGETGVTFAPGATNLQLNVDGLWLEPGCYVARLRARSAVSNEVAGTLRFIVPAGPGSAAHTVAMRLPADGTPAELRAAFELPGILRDGRLRVEPSRGGLTIEELEVRPDPLATMRALRRELAGRAE